ncbi:hypothetical protein DDB_G0280583 [Dictyostelium discoideum AX4]|uniref:G domain-containing protein n=1 Tax=Dictyostelium discoideum TaxID=44689 RepID=Q54V69_DICDI|nr:hypothetical protein DDB_G0280583 [Dictyostelium discoideum AX4]EAL67093.1 hypothetical protein DDB_G0280583 [Dictyostelium discoideum AX4]|eukprot:XP_641062.1 hypothetical protein DDB_G0280583 [Dictyostelium discoideum AX4]
MSLILPIPVNTLLITENDLGRGFSIDDNGNAKKSEVFICEKEYIKSSFPKTDSNNLTLIRDSESLKSALDVGGEISLSYGLISGKVMGNYIDTNTSSNERMTFLYTRRIVDKIVELDYHAKPSQDISKVDNIDSLKSTYGLFYISKIEYGAILDLRITLESSDKGTMNKIKGELSGSISIGALSLSVKAHIDKEESSSSSKLKVTSSVLMGGCKPIDKTDVKNFDDAMKVIDSFKVDQDRLIPVRMEISPIPTRATLLLSIDPLSLNHYKSKVSSIGSFYWDLQQMIIILDAFKNNILSPLLADDEKAIYIKTLYSNISNLNSSLKDKLESLIKFLQKRIEYILVSEPPFSDSDISEIRLNAQQMIGTTQTETDKGRWAGPTINKIPTYKGTYKYKYDDSKYDGLCLDGKRHGEGILTYAEGNIDQIKSIDGIWDNDEVSFPSIITYEGGEIEKINNKGSSIIWRERLKKKKISNSILHYSNISTPEHILKYFVNVDLINNTDFLDFYKDSVLSLGDRKSYNFMFLGMQGIGKTTIIELLLNILTGQFYDGPKQLCEETNGILNKTKTVCSYEIIYCSNNTRIFTITLVDTPGFIGSDDSIEDCKLLKYIISKVGKLEAIDNVSYVINNTLTRKTHEPLRVLHNIFSILPKEAFECLSTIITFCDDSNQEIASLNILNEILAGIKYKPSFFIDNQWSQDQQDKFKELQNLNKTKISIIQKFFIQRIQSKSTFDQKKEMQAQQLIESKITKTEIGTWVGLTFNKIPTYFGTYKYFDGSEYEGFCLDGKRHGEGKFNYCDSNVNQLKSADGMWKNDDVYFPSIVTYKGGKIENIIDESSLKNWNESLIKKKTTDINYDHVLKRLIDLESIVNSIDTLTTDIRFVGNDFFGCLKRVEIERQIDQLKTKFENQVSELEEVMKEFPDISVLDNILNSKRSEYKLQIENSQKDKNSGRASYFQKILDKIQK